MTVCEVDLDVRNDGKDHLRIGAHARTLLGRLLANEALTPFRHPTLGHFSSLEAYWAYVKSGMRCEELRTLAGAHALRNNHACVRVPNPQFRRLIIEGLTAKIESHPQLQKLLAENRLEFIRYEVVDGELLVERGQPWFLKALKKLVSEHRTRWLAT